MDTKETDIFGENLSDACTCWVCFEIFQDPTTLPCSHSMCRECLMKAYRLNPSCPFCRRPFSPPFPPVNQDLKQLVDEHKKSVRSKPSEQKVPLLMLPDEMLIEIFSHLREKEIGRIAQVCKHLNRITDNGWLWRLLCTESFPFLVVVRILHAHPLVLPNIFGCFGFFIRSPIRCVRRTSQRKIGRIAIVFVIE
jgi:hypothetical protein